MPVHISTRTIESKAIPGARFVLRRMTKRRADALNEKQAAFRDRLRVIYDEFTPLDKERVEARENFPADKLKRWGELLTQINKIDADEMAPVAVRFVLARIEGLDIETEDATLPATLDLIMEHGPDELYQEILHEVKRECGLLPEEAENLNSPSTSAAAVDGIPDSAESAETPATITPAAA